MSPSKGSQRLCIAKCTMSVNQGPVIQISVRKGTSVNAKFFKGNVLYKLKKYFKKQATGLRGVRLLQDNALSHKAAIERKYLKQENVVDLTLLTLLSRQILTFSSFQNSKNTLQEENIKREKNSVRLFSIPRKDPEK